MVQGKSAAQQPTAMEESSDDEEESSDDEVAPNPAQVSGGLLQTHLAFCAFSASTRTSQEHWSDDPRKQFAT
jgi:hypothetical protein